METSDSTLPGSPALRHRTVGISMGPALEQRAKARAEALGLKFSPYVTLCIEAELKGFAQIVRDDSLDLDAAMQRAREYLERKTQSIDFDADVESVLQRCGLRYECHGRVGAHRVDFLISMQGPGGAARNVVLEGRYNIRQNYALALGQTLLLRAHPDVDAVVLAVPYLEGFDAAVLRQFQQQGIHVTTPDRLEALLKLKAEG